MTSLVAWKVGARGHPSAEQQTALLSGAKIQRGALVHVLSAAASEHAEPHDARRRYYRLTPLGITAARAETELMARLVDVAAAAGLLDEARRSTA